MHHRVNIRIAETLKAIVSRFLEAPNNNFQCSLSKENGPLMMDSGHNKDSSLPEKTADEL